MNDLDRYYEVLELPPGASLEDVRRAYRDLVQVWHPDRFAASERLRTRAEAKLKELNEAYRELVAVLEAAGGGRPEGGGADERVGTVEPIGAARDGTRRLGEALRRAVPRGRWRLLGLVAVPALAGFAAVLVVGVGRVPGGSGVVLAAGGGVPRFVSVSAGAQHACGVEAGGGVICWGANYGGQAGESTDAICVGSSDVPEPCNPVARRLPGTAGVTAVASGYDHTCAVGPGGTAFCWGAGFAGQLGDGGTADRAAPSAVAGGASFVSLSARGQHTCGLTGGGAVLCWGSDVSGQLGSPGASGLCRLYDREFACRARPAPVAGAESWVAVSAGGSHTCALSADGGLYCWGSNRSGQLGVSSVGLCLGDMGASELHPCSSRPQRVGGDVVFRTVVAGASHTCATDVDGRAYCWGENEYGQLGDGTTHARRTPAPVAAEFRFTALAAGGFHTCGVTTDGAGYCWGRNVYGELGAMPGGEHCNGLPCSSAPVRVPMRGLRALEAGFEFTCAVARNGRGRCWGRNHLGQLGTGASADAGAMSPEDARVSGPGGTLRRAAHAVLRVPAALGRGAARIVTRTAGAVGSRIMREFP